MKLRNKKTGEIEELGCIHLLAKNSKTINAYKTLAEVCDNWEDYEPKEPLIKDEKIRKAVRAWAEINEICGAEYGQNAGASWFVFKDCKGRELTNIGFLNRCALSKSENGNAHTIAELCGEEE